MLIGFNVDALRQQHVRDAALRFALGAAISAAAAVIAVLFGPRVGGAFLAFPAILPASVTLVAKHHEARKARVGLKGTVRARRAAALDAFGALLGAAGLFTFALTVDAIVTRVSHAATLAAATLIWLVIATIVWACRRVL